MKQINVSLRLGYPHQMGPGGPHENFARLEIHDEASGTHFLELELDATQLMNLMRGSTAYTTAEMRGLDRLGKRMEHASARIAVPSVPEAEVDALAQSWAKATGPWDAVQVGKHREGWHVTGRRWVEVEQSEKSGS